MTGLVDDKVGLVTGAASGIGRASAIAFAREGATVVVSDLAEARAGGEETVNLIERQGGKATFFACDVASAADAKALVEHTVREFGCLDFAHNNAGIEVHALLADTEEQDFDRIMEVNLKGVWLGMKYQIPQMVYQGYGAIVNTSSLAGLISAPEIGVYAASKHGVAGLTKAGALDYADKGIRVNAVCPAAIRTPLLTDLAPSQQQDLIAPQAIKRMGEPEEVAAAVVWLCSDQASFVTGHAMPVDAGAMAR